ncbi:HAMP domain-containing sensor histidine kinase [Helicovermis profundi]|uniref:histidine kinase n=1 Tax=Helicovermis profundi TaxID=3065157 RepID=A0AAU9EVD0_9FIRM|nr:cell wall metabolism sensor histidine kinase WalK [Clostridia bacterium S502]
MFKSIRWRFIVIYFMLVFIGMIISGVFIIRSTEQYNFNVIENRIDDISDILMPRISSYNDLSENADKIQDILTLYSGAGFREEIFVIKPDDKFSIIATTSQNVGRDALNVLNFDLVVASSNGSVEKTFVKDNKSQIKTLDKSFPIGKEGILYIRYDLSDVYNSIDKFKIIIVQATLLALIVTVVLGIFIANSITNPINEITAKAAKMASGDFDQTVDVKSKDEIGKLGEMFNYLTNRLKVSVSEISREKSKLETIINYMDDGLVAVNKKGEIIHLNPKAIEMLNFTETSLDFDKTIRELNENLVIEKIIADNKWIGSEIIKFENMILKVSYAPYANENGEKSGIVFVLQDITDQERLEKMRREFVANVSHELKTPLTSIKSYTETILDGYVDDEDTKIEFLKVVNNEADRMNRLVRDLLQLSSFDNENIKLEKEYHDYVNMVKYSIKKVEVTAKNKNQTINLVTDLDNLVGYFDYDRIEQVALNILSNAIKYSPNGSIINTFLTKIDENVSMTIQDNGFGIPEKDINRIFERFYRVDKARSRELGGTGLGLSIAKEIVEAHLGKIKITSKLEKGTTVNLLLPLDLEEY